jgi:hypothetical protein
VRKTDAFPVPDKAALIGGLISSPKSKRESIAHTGEQPEVATHLILFLKRKNGIVVLCNCGYAKASAISLAVATALAEP